MRVKLIEKAQGQQSAHPEIATLLQETIKMYKKMDYYIIEEVAGIGAIHQGIHLIESKIEALLLRFNSKNFFF